MKAIFKPEELENDVFTCGHVNDGDECHLFTDHEAHYICCQACFDKKPINKLKEQICDAIDETNRHRVIWVPGLGGYSVGNVRLGKRDVCMFSSSLANEVAMHIINDVIALDVTEDTIYALEGGWRILVRVIPVTLSDGGMGLTRHVFLQDHWLQIHLSDTENRLPGEEGFVDSSDNPARRFEDYDYFDTDADYVPLNIIPKLNSLTKYIGD